jgi:hypothetical protein
VESEDEQQILNITVTTKKLKLSNEKEAVSTIKKLHHPLTSEETKVADVSPIRSFVRGVDEILQSKRKLA